MSNFSSFERKIASFLSRFPTLKRGIKRTYQGLNYALYAPSHRKRCESTLRAVGTTSMSTFFGYYDSSPQSTDGRYELLHAFDGPTTHPPRKDDSVQILVVDAESGKDVCTFASAAFNWQQGSRLQWMDEDRFVFNDLSDDGTHYVARVASMQSGAIEETYERPLQDAHRDDYFISLNYRRIRALRPDYGYFSLPPSSPDALQRMHDDGLWCVDYATGAEALIYSLADVCDVKPRPAFTDSVHYANHVMISPTGDSFVFLHRYVHNGQRVDRLLVGDRDGSDLCLLVDTGFVSHYCWVDAETLLGYMRGRDGGDGYYAVNVMTGEMKSVLHGQLDAYGDGHPTIHEHRLVTDTYPNKGRMQTLLLCDLETGSVREIAEFHHGLRYDAQTRCDLHPRLAPDGKTVYVDSVFDGQRRLYAVSVPEDATQSTA